MRASIYAPTKFFKSYILTLKHGVNPEFNEKITRVYNCLKSGEDTLEDFTCYYIGCKVLTHITPFREVIIPSTHWNRDKLSIITGEYIPSRASIIEEAIKVCAVGSKFIVEEGNKNISKILNARLVRTERNEWTKMEYNNKKSQFLGL